MPRWEPNALERLHDAAIELFVEQGFDQTTVAEIAERAGLTERTFFNHFPSKREVLFGRTSEVQKQVVVRAIAACPPGLRPLEAVIIGLQAAADEVLEDFRAPAALRRVIIETTPELQEREEGKRAALIAAVAASLVERGVSNNDAFLFGGIGLLVQQAAEQRWILPDECRPLRELLPEALAKARVLIANDAPHET